MDDTTYKNSDKKGKVMDFLKVIFGDKPLTHEEFVNAINAHNGNEANKDNLIKLANLSSGEYVSKAKHDALQALLDGKTTELDTANNLIAEFKKGTKGNEELQGKITTYETQTIPQLQEQLKKTQIESEVKIALLAAGVNPDDIDYISFKMNSSGEALELGEDGKIKGIDEKITALKTQYPKQFEGTTGGGGLKVEPLKLPEGEGGGKAEPQSLADALAQKYQSNNLKNI